MYLEGTETLQMCFHPFALRFTFSTIPVTNWGTESQSVEHPTMSSEQHYFGIFFKNQTNYTSRVLVP